MEFPTGRETRVELASENIRFSTLSAAGDISRGGASFLITERLFHHHLGAWNRLATQRQKFHTDDVKSVRNPVRSADWATEYLHCLSYCLRMTDKRQKATKVKCKRQESLTKQSIIVEYGLFSRRRIWVYWSSLADEHNALPKSTITPQAAQT